MHDRLACLLRPARLGVLAAAAVLWGGCGEPPSTAPIGEDVVLTTSDGLSISGMAWPQNADTPRSGVLLLHQLQDTRQQWDTYIQRLIDEDYRVLAIDLRSHGESDEATVDRGDLVVERDQALLDVEAAFEWLASDEGTDPEHLGVIGTGLGGSLAIAAAHSGFGADLAVAVSARETSVTALTGEELANLSLRGLFVIASDDESGGEQATSANDLYEQSTPPRKLRVLPGSDSGSGLVAAEGVFDDILEFLALEL